MWVLKCNEIKKRLITQSQKSASYFTIKPICCNKGVKHILKHSDELTKKYILDYINVIRVSKMDSNLLRMRALSICPFDIKENE